MEPSVARSLTVCRSDLTAAAKRLRHLTTDTRLRTIELVLRAEHGYLMLEIPGAAEGVPATGQWSGRVRAPGIVVTVFAKGEPPGDPLQLAYEDGYLHVHAGAHI